MYLIMSVDVETDNLENNHELRIIADLVVIN